MKNLDNRAFTALLREIGGCGALSTWVGARDMRTAWDECPRADWMLWLLGQLADEPGYPTRQQVVLTACACAETALAYVPADENRPRQALEAARRWADGKATFKEVYVAAAYADDLWDAAFESQGVRRAAYAADPATADDAGSFAANATYAFAHAAKAASFAAFAIEPAFAVEVAYHASHAIDAAFAPAEEKERKRRALADAVREALSLTWDEAVKADTFPDPDDE